MQVIPDPGHPWSSPFPRAADDGIGGQFLHRMDLHDFFAPPVGACWGPVGGSRDVGMGLVPEMKG